MNHFEPSIARARECREAMDESLWSSSRELLEELGAGDRLSAGGGDASDDEPAGFLDYAAYFDLALETPGQLELSDEERQFAIDRLAARIPAGEKAQPRSAPARISRFTEGDFSGLELKQMHRWWDIEPANRMAMTNPSDEEYALAQERIPIALKHLREASPELHGEVEWVVRDIIMTKPDGTNLINYSGASSFALWGALTINAETQREWMQHYRQIVHETGHNLLFGIARDEPLVTDDPSDRRASPIRADLRPIDGIFHAAFVSARESLSFDALLCHHEKVGCLVDDEPQIMEDLLEISVLAFWDAVQTLRADDVHLTGLGDAVLGDCEAYMNENFAVEPC